MNIIPFRLRSRSSRREPQRLPPFRFVSPDRRIVWSLRFVIPLIAILVLMLGYADLRTRSAEPGEDAAPSLPQFLFGGMPGSAFEVEYGGAVARGRVVDGDTLAVGTVRLRLHGIDAPEHGQTCERAGRGFACGEAATRALLALVQGQRIRCEALGVDAYRRHLATCFRSDGADIARRMVASGWALAYRRYSLAYARDEDDARRHRLGLWAGDFADPHLWRSGQR